MEINNLTNTDKFYTMEIDKYNANLKVELFIGKKRSNLQPQKNNVIYR